MKIGYISPYDPFRNKNAWSGTYYSTRAALEEAGNEVEWISYPVNGLLTKICRQIYNAIYKNKELFIHSRLASWSKTRKLKNFDKYDVIFIPAQVDILAGIKTKTPIVYYTDGTVPLMDGYYWFGYTDKAITEAKKQEALALKNAKLSLFSSDWARESAINDYSISENKCITVPFGANLTSSDLAGKINKTFDKKRVNVLFSGVDWERKGGAIAVETVKKLVADGYDATLSIVGIKDLDDEIKQLDFVNYVGFLDKENKTQYQKYLEMWRKTDIMILPTRAECSAIVYNEAAAFGVPIISTDTGGVPNYVINGKNGQRLPLSAGGYEYAKVIEQWLDDGNKLSEMSKNAKELYNTTNSWPAWGRRVNKLLNDIIEI